MNQLQGLLWVGQSPGLMVLGAAAIAHNTAHGQCNTLHVLALHYLFLRQHLHVALPTHWCARAAWACFMGLQENDSVVV